MVLSSNTTDFQPSTESVKAVSAVNGNSRMWQWGKVGNSEADNPTEFQDREGITFASTLQVLQLPDSTSYQ